MNPRPPILPHPARRSLLRRDDRDGRDDGRGREAGAVGGLDADAVLDEHDAAAGPDERRDERAVVREVGQGFGGDDDVIPAVAVVVDAAGGVGGGGGCGDGGEDGVRLEGVGAEGVGFQVHA